MANVFGILTTIVLLIAGFVAYKNKGAYETAISSAESQRQSLAASENRFNTAKDNLASTLAERTEVDAEIVQLTDDEAAQKKSNVDMKSDIESKTTEVASNKEKLDDIRESTANVGDIKELASKMSATNAELEELSQEITSAEAKLANLTALSTQSEAQVDKMKKRFEAMSSGQSLPTLNTRIRSIYPTWGFVTLATGNSGGVVANSTLDVVRGGSVVAKLLVTSVERNSASASIVPDSVDKETTVMRGDRVIASQKAVKN